MFEPIPDSDPICGGETFEYAHRAPDLTNRTTVLTHVRADVTCPRCQLYIAFADANRISLERPAELARRIIERVMEL